MTVGTHQQGTRRIVTAAVIIGITLIALLLLAMRSSNTLPGNARFVFSNDDFRVVNRGLAVNGFVSIPTGDQAAPQNCPQGGDHCIWLCTGTDPLDGIDENTCSTGDYICLGCGSGGEDVCEDSNGNTIPCS